MHIDLDDYTPSYVHALFYASASAVCAVEAFRDGFKAGQAETLSELEEIKSQTATFEQE